MKKKGVINIILGIQKKRETTTDCFKSVYFFKLLKVFVCVIKIKIMRTYFVENINIYKDEILHILVFVRIMYIC